MAKCDPDGPGGGGGAGGGSAGRGSGLVAPLYFGAARGHLGQRVARERHVRAVVEKVVRPNVTVDRYGGKGEGRGAGARLWLGVFFCFFFVFSILSDSMLLTTFFFFFFSPSLLLPLLPHLQQQGIRRRIRVWDDGRWDSADGPRARVCAVHAGRGTRQARRAARDAHSAPPQSPRGAGAFGRPGRHGRGRAALCLCAAAALGVRVRRDIRQCNPV
jgi:hypothetical protein